MTDDEISKFAERFYIVGHSGQLTFDVNSYTRALLAASEASSDELRQLREFVVAVGGIWEPSGTRSKLVGENSLAESISRDSKIAADYAALHLTPEQAAKEAK
jgi:hypothetical protein